MPPLTLSQAAKEAKKAKSAVLEAIRTGRLSATRNELNQWQIEPAELFRVYPQNRTENSSENQDRTPSENAYIEQLTMLRAERDRERQQLQATIDDLRNRLDQESIERRKLTALLTHQASQQTEQTPENSSSGKGKLYEKLFGKRP